MIGRDAVLPEANEYINIYYEIDYSAVLKTMSLSSIGMPTSNL